MFRYNYQSLIIRRCQSWWLDLLTSSIVSTTTEASRCHSITVTRKIMSSQSQLNTADTAKHPSNKVTKTIITSPEIYPSLGPYSQAILADKTLYVSGVLGMDKEGQLVCGGAEAETRQILENMTHILVAGGASLESVVKTTILLNNIEDFSVVNAVYKSYFTKDYPARATFQVGRLPANASVEIEAIALSGDLVVAEAGPCPCARV